MAGEGFAETIRVLNLILTELLQKTEPADQQHTIEATASSATLSNIASSATNVTLFAANANRRMAAIFNDSTAILYAKFGATATASSYTIKMAAGAYYEFPFPMYVGIVDGIWASANGAARCTEIA